MIASTATRWAFLPVLLAVIWQDAGKAKMEIILKYLHWHIVLDENYSISL
jgi:hypothetical protein